MPVRILHLSIVLLLCLSGGALAQTQTDSETARRLAIQRFRNREIPDATQPCTPEEAKWWHDLKEAARAVKDTRGANKESQHFLDLLQLGQEKAYRPPVTEMKVFILSKPEPVYSNKARSKRINGTVTMRAELRPDGFVGDVKIVKGLGYGLDENSEDAARRMIFLPAVKDRKFVSHMVLMENNFATY